MLIRGKSLLPVFRWPVEIETLIKNTMNRKISKRKVRKVKKTKDQIRSKRRDKRDEKYACRFMLNI